MPDQRLIAVRQAGVSEQRGGGTRSRCAEQTIRGIDGRLEAKVGVADDRDPLRSEGDLSWSTVRYMPTSYLSWRFANHDDDTTRLWDGYQKHCCAKMHGCSAKPHEGTGIQGDAQGGMQRDGQCVSSGVVAGAGDVGEPRDEGALSHAASRHDSAEDIEGSSDSRPRLLTSCERLGRARTGPERVLIISQSEGFECEHSSPRAAKRVGAKR